MSWSGFGYGALNAIKKAPPVQALCQTAFGKPAAGPEFGDALLTGEKRLPKKRNLEKRD
jgi:hypothetical protein